MAKLKTSEKRLLTMFGLVAFVLGNLFVWNLYEKKKNLVEFEIADSRARIEELRFLLPEKEMWEKRRAWMQARLPLYTSETEEAPKLEGAVQQAANLAGVEIDIKPIAHFATPQYQQIGVAVKASGSNEDIIRFLSLLQNRDAFRLMPTLDVKPDKKDPSIVRAELTLNQLYSLETYTAPVEEEDTPGTENPGKTEEEPNVASTVPTQTALTGKVN